MTLRIAITGKGGTGKTTIASLMIKVFEERIKEPILVIDADPNSNLNELLGVEVKSTVGDAREKLLRDRDKLPPEQTKEEYLDYLFRGSLVECDKFDLIVMGRPEGPGCYCYINNILRKIIDSMSERYPVVLIDAEAGLEHLSRRTTQDLDILLIVTDPTMRGALTAKRIKDLCNELQIRVGKTFLVVNRLPEGIAVEDIVKFSGLECITTVPEDPSVKQLDFEGRPLTELAETSPAFRAINRLVERLPLRQVVV